MKKSFYIVFIIMILSLLCASCAFADSELMGGAKQVKKSTSRRSLSNYQNPVEIDIDGLHISFKGAFREEENGKPTDNVGFCFVVTPQKDMEIDLSQTELFDSRGTRFQNFRDPIIGRERTWRREIIADIPMPIIIRSKVPVSEAEVYPFVARISFKFNKQWYQFRNIQVEEWSNWEAIKADLGL